MIQSRFQGKDNIECHAEVLKEIDN